MCIESGLVNLCGGGYGLYVATGRYNGSQHCGITDGQHDIYGNGEQWHLYRDGHGRGKHESQSNDQHIGLGFCGLSGSSGNHDGERRDYLYLVSGDYERSDVYGHTDGTDPVLGGRNQQFWMYDLGQPGGVDHFKSDD
jgi:hypothetical protein